MCDDGKKIDQNNPDSGGLNRPISRVSRLMDRPGLRPVIVAVGTVRTAGVVQLDRLSLWMRTRTPSRAVVLCFAYLLWWFGSLIVGDLTGHHVRCYAYTLPLAVIIIARDQKRSEEGGVVWLAARLSILAYRVSLFGDWPALASYRRAARRSDSDRMERAECRQVRNKLRRTARKERVERGTDRLWWLMKRVVVVWVVSIAADFGVNKLGVISHPAAQATGAGLLLSFVLLWVLAASWFAIAARYELVVEMDQRWLSKMERLARDTRPSDWKAVGRYWGGLAKDLIEVIDRLNR